MCARMQLRVEALVTLSDVFFFKCVLVFIGEVARKGTFSHMIYITEN